MSDSVKIFSDSMFQASDYAISQSEIAKLNSLALHTNIEVSQNEPMLNQIFTRPAKKLLENDIALYELYKAVFNQLNITDFSISTPYKAGDLVWYQKNNELYLLKSIFDENSNVPNIQLSDGQPIESLLKISGWENENRYLTVFDYGIKLFLQSLADVRFDQHQHNVSMHPLGKISLDKDSNDYIGNKLLKSDMSNIDPARQTTFFPQQVHKLNAGVAVLDGYMRNYGRILEYDIVLMLASSTPPTQSETFMSQASLSANVLKLSMNAGLTKNSVSYQDNGRYFGTSESMDIFAPYVADVKTSRIGMSTQYNRNGYVNTYSATITFPKPFADRDYMVFSNSVLSQTNGIVSDDGTKCLVPSANDIVVCNKTRDSITLVNIAFSPNNQDPEKNASNGGIAANSFHCKVIGTIGA